MLKLRYEVRCHGPLVSEGRKEEKPQVSACVDSYQHSPSKIVLCVQNRNCHPSFTGAGVGGSPHSSCLPPPLSGVSWRQDVISVLTTGVSHPSHMAAESLLDLDKV